MADANNRPRALPEMQLPWLLHLLAHHPDFTSEVAAAEAIKKDGDGIDGRATLSNTQKCVDIYLNACLAGTQDASFDLMRAVTDQVTPCPPRTR